MGSIIKYKKKNILGYQLDQDSNLLSLKLKKPWLLPKSGTCKS